MTAKREPIKVAALVCTTLGFLTATTILYLIYTDPAGGWEWEKFVSWVFGLIFTLLFLSPYVRLFYAVRRAAFSIARLIGVLVIIAVGLWIEANAYIQYGHGTPFFLLIAGLIQHLLVFLAQAVWKEESRAVS